VLSSDAMVIMEFGGGHHVPTKTEDIERLAALVVRISKELYPLQSLHLGWPSGRVRPRF